MLFELFDELFGGAVFESDDIVFVEEIDGRCGFDGVLYGESVIDLDAQDLDVGGQGVGLHPCPYRVAVFAVGVIEKEAKPLVAVFANAVCAAVVGGEGEVACRVAGEIDRGQSCPEAIAAALCGVGMAVVGDGVEQQAVGAVVAQWRAVVVEVLVDEAVKAPACRWAAPCLVDEDLCALRPHVFAEASQKVDVVDKALLAVVL